MVSDYPNQDIQQLEQAVIEIRTILLTILEPEAAERFRVSWFPRDTDE